MPDNRLIVIRSHPATQHNAGLAHKHAQRTIAADLLKHYARKSKAGYHYNWAYIACYIDDVLKLHPHLRDDPDVMLLFEKAKKLSMRKIATHIRNRAFASLP